MYGSKTLSKIVNLFSILTLNNPILTLGSAFPCFMGRQVTHQCLRLTLLCSHILEKSVVDVLYLPRELTLELPGFIAENLYSLYVNNNMTPMRVTDSRYILNILKSDLLNVTLFNQKARCHCFYIAILLHF